MNDDPSPSPPKRRKIRRWQLAVLVFLAILAGCVQYWYVNRTAPYRHFLAGREAFSRGDLDAVSTAAESLQDKPGYEPHYHLLKGMLLLRDGQLAEAISECGYAREHSDTCAMAYALSGEALYKAGQFRDAPRILGVAVKLDPSQTDARRWLAATYYDIGVMHLALEQLSIVAKQAPRDPRPHRLMALIDKDFQKYGTAIKEYRESLRRDPRQPDRDEILVELAECLLRERRHDEALDTLGQCSRSAQVAALEAECQYGKHHKAAARELIGEALELAPDNLSAMRLAGKMDLEDNDAQAAVEVLRRAVERHPTRWRVRYQLSQAYQRLGQGDLAAQQVEAMQEYRELHESFTKLHERAMADQSDAEVRYQLGLLAQRMDMPEVARTWFIAALGLDSNHEGARRALSGYPKRGDGR